MQIVLCAARPLTIIAKWEWPKTAKNRGEPQKMTHSTETEIFRGGPNVKVVARAYW